MSARTNPAMQPLAAGEGLSVGTSTNSTHTNSSSIGGCLRSKTSSSRAILPTNSTGKPLPDSRMTDSKRLSSPGESLLRAFGRERVTVVIKIGTSTLMDERSRTPNFSLSNIGKLVDTICLLRSKGVSVVLVTSGAVGAGCVSLHLRKRPEALRHKQALAAVGQCRLMRLYEDLFGVREVRVAQLLVSRNDFLRQRTYSNFRNCLLSLLDMSVVPILNENDSICTEELRFGDNDTLAAHCAVALEADFLFILTDVDCVYTRNPKLFPDARPVYFVDRFTDVYSYLSVSETGVWGTGGMHTKVVASKIATNLGVHVGIVNGAYPERLIQILHFAADNLLPNPASSLSTGELETLIPSQASATACGAADDEATDGSESESSCSSVAELPGGFPASGSPTKGGIIADQLVTGQQDSPQLPYPPSLNHSRPCEVAVGDGSSSGHAETFIGVVKRELLPSPAFCSTATAAADSKSRSLELRLTATSKQDAEAGRTRSSDTNSSNSNSSGSSSLVTEAETPGEESQLATKRRAAPRERQLQYTASSNRSDGVLQDACPRQKPSPAELAATATAAQAAVAQPTAVAGKEIFHSVGCPKRAHRHMLMHQQEEQQQRKQHQQQQQSQLLQQQSHDLLRQQTRIQFAVPDEEAVEKASSPFLGTVFVSQAPSGPSQSTRLVRRWILALPVRGELYVDVGCARSLVLHRKSLFAAGIKEVKGTFVSGECLSIFLHGYQSCSSAMSAEIGRCVTSFSSEELNIVKGHQSREFEGLLGYSVDQEVAHRHNLVLVYMNGDKRLQKICEGKEAL